MVNVIINSIHGSYGCWFCSDCFVLSRQKWSGRMRTAFCCLRPMLQNTSCRGTVPACSLCLKWLKHVTAFSDHRIAVQLWNPWDFPEHFKRSVPTMSKAEAVTEDRNLGGFLVHPGFLRVFTALLYYIQIELLSKSIFCIYIYIYMCVFAELTPWYATAGWNWCGEYRGIQHIWPYCVVGWCWVIIFLFCFLPYVM